MAFLKDGNYDYYIVTIAAMVSGLHYQNWMLHVEDCSYTAVGTVVQ